MVRVSATIAIAATAERTWRVIADPARFGDWAADDVSFVGEPPPDYLPGATFRQRIRVLGRPVEATWRVVDVVAPERLLLAGSAPMGIGLDAAYRVHGQPDGVGSRVQIDFGFHGLAAAMVAGQLTAEVEHSLRGSLEMLKKVVEQGDRDATSR